MVGVHFLQALRRSIRLSIRAKLLIVSLALLVVPFIGYKYIQEMEAYLRGQQDPPFEIRGANGWLCGRLDILPCPNPGLQYSDP
jgi:hypothetical protein